MAMFVYTTFTGGTGDLLDHVGEVGAAWARNGAFPAVSGKNNKWQITGTGAAYPVMQAYGTANPLCSGVPPGTEYDIRSTWTFHTNTHDQRYGITFRGSSSADTCLRLVYLTEATLKRWRLLAVTAGVETTLGNFPDAIAAGSTREILVEVRDAGVTVKIDGTQQFTTTNATSGGDRIGLWGYGSNPSSPTSGLNVELFAAGDPGFSIPAYTVTGASSGPPGFDSTDFTFTLNDGINPGTLTITPAVSGFSGAFTPATVTLTDAARSATCTLRPADAATGTGTISFSNNGSLVDAPSLSYTAAFAPPSREAYWASQLSRRHSSGAVPYVAGTGSTPDGSEHYGPDNAFQKVEAYSVAKGLAVTDYSVQKAAGQVRYRDRIVLAQGNGLPEYHRFASGVARHYLENGSNDASDLTAMGYLAPARDVSTYFGLYAHPGAYREAALYLVAFVERDRMGLGVHPTLNEAIRTCLYQNSLYQLEVPRYGVWHKPFMGALNMRALTLAWERYRHTADATLAALIAQIPASVKNLCTYIWDECWYPAGPNLEYSPGAFWDKGSVAYRDLPNDDPRFFPITNQAITAVIEPRSVFRGPDTLSTIDDHYKDAALIFSGHDDFFGVASYTGAAREFTIKSVYRPNWDITTSHTVTVRPSAWQGDEGNGPAPELNHMVAPAFAWAYWHERIVLGDLEASKDWRAKYHTIFDSCYQSWNPAFSQKVYNQDALWTTDGLAWAAAADAGSADPDPPPSVPHTLWIDSPNGGWLHLTRPEVPAG